MLETITLFPHPPIVIPEVGGKESHKVAKTYKAMKDLAEEICAIEPASIIAVTPHGHIFQDALTIPMLNSLKGNLRKFGASQIELSYELDKELANSLINESRKEKIFCAGIDNEILNEYNLSAELDHGLIVPLYFINKCGWKGRLVQINIGLLPYEDLYKFGNVLAAVADKTGKKIVLLISGDMSHRLTPDAPAGYSPKGAEFDRIIRECVQKGEAEPIFSLEQEIIEEAGECGLRPLIIGMGALDGYKSISEEISYEGPFGVGYLVAKMQRDTKDSDRKLEDILREKRKEKIREKLDKESSIVKLARDSIKHYLKTGQYLNAKEWFKDNNLTETKNLFTQKAGTFVSLKKEGQLRGCIGTIKSERLNLAEEVINNAVSAAVNDPRFEPLDLEELDGVIISVDVLGSPERVLSLDELNPKKYGVIVSKGYRKGLLLPDLAGIDNPYDQVRIAKEKAGISYDESVEMERFKVDRYY